MAVFKFLSFFLFTVLLVVTLSADILKVFPTFKWDLVPSCCLNSVTLSLPWKGPACVYVDVKLQECKIDSSQTESNTCLKQTLLQ